jgi:hypothetical protein
MKLGYGLVLRPVIITARIINDNRWDCLFGVSDKSGGFFCETKPFRRFAIPGHKRDCNQHVAAAHGTSSGRSSSISAWNSRDCRPRQRIIRV